MRDRLSEFLEQSGPGLYSLLVRLTLREDVAQDLMQELFIKLSHSKSFDRAANPIAYVRGAAINLAFDWRRTQKSLPLSLDNVGEPVSNENSPLSTLVQTEELEEILNAIGQLNGISREAFVMHYIQQDSYEQIAHALRKNSHQVRALCSKALSRLRDLLKGGR